MNSTINEQHLSRTAYGYVRQPTMGQVRHHQESTEPKYALRRKAVELGWSEPATRVVTPVSAVQGKHVYGIEFVEDGGWSRTLWGITFTTNT